MSSSSFLVIFLIVVIVFAVVSYNQSLQYERELLAIEQARLELAIKGIKENPAEFSEIYTINLSAYNSDVRQTDSTPFITASGRRCKPGTIALSRDLLTRYTEGAPFTFGDQVLLIKVYGIFDVDDSMASRWTMKGDIWKETETEANNFGIHKGVVMIKL